MKGEREGAGQDLLIETNRHVGILLQADRLVAGRLVHGLILTNRHGSSLVCVQPNRAVFAEKSDSLNAERSRRPSPLAGDLIAIL